MKKQPLLIAIILVAISLLTIWYARPVIGQGIGSPACLPTASECELGTSGHTPYLPWGEWYNTNSDIGLMAHIDSVTHSWRADPGSGYNFDNAVLTKWCGEANYHWLTSERLSPNPAKWGPWTCGHPGIECPFSGCTLGHYTITDFTNTNEFFKVCVGASDTNPGSADLFNHPLNRCSKIWRIPSGIDHVGIFNVYGRVTNGSGTAISNVNISYGSGNATTNSSGNYSFINLEDDTYRLTPSKDCYSFSPASLLVSYDSLYHVTGQDFVGTLLPADIEVNEGLVLSPTTQVISDSVEALFNVYNYGCQSANVRLRVTTNGAGEFPEVDCNSLARGASCSYTQTLSITQHGTFNACAQMRVNGGTWQNIPATSGHNTCTDLTIIRPADPQINYGLMLEPATQVTGDNVTASFRIHNYGDVDIALRLRVTTTADAGNFEEIAHNLIAGSDYAYSGTQAFTQHGNFTACAQMSKDGGVSWENILAQPDSQACANLVIQRPPEPRINIGLILTPLVQVINQEVNSTFNVHNYGDQRIDLQLRVAGDNAGDFAISSCPLEPTKDCLYDAVSTFSLPGTFNMCAQMSTDNGNTWQNIPSDPDSSAGTCLDLKIVTPPNPQVTEGLYLNPTSQSVEEPVIASFTVQNYGGYTASMHLRVTTDGAGAFDTISYDLAPEEAFVYSTTRSFNLTGEFAACAQMRLDGGTWQNIPTDSGRACTTLTLYSPPDPQIKEGLTIQPPIQKIGHAVNASFTIQNYGGSIADLYLRVTTNDGGDFETVLGSIPPSEDYVYSKTRTFDDLGTFNTCAQMSWDGNTWENIPVNLGTACTELTIRPEGDDYETDDVCTDATPITPDGTIQHHTFHDAEDTDWVRFTAMASQTYFIEISNLAHQTNTTIRLRAACDAIPIPIDDNHLGPGTRIPWHCANAGEHFIQIHNDTSNVYGDMIGYDLSVKIDTEPPPPPVGLEVTAGNEHLHVKWNRSSKQDVTGYRLYYGTAAGEYLDVVEITDRDTPHYLLENLINEQAYYLTVSAVDFSGKESDKSTEVTGTPNTPATDVNPPEVHILQPSDDTGGYGDGGIYTTTLQTIDIKAQAHDPEDHLHYIQAYNITTNEKSGAYDTATSDGIAVISEVPLQEHSLNQIKIQAYDTAGNMGYVELTVYQQSPQGVVIIIAGRNGSLQDNINYCTNRAYKIFREAGFAADNIFYLNHEAQDVNNDGLTDVNDAATLPNIERAITEWAQGRLHSGDKFFLYMMDHGGNEDMCPPEGCFCADGCESGGIPPSLLHDWLDNLPTEVEENIIIDACYSGRFITNATSIAKPGRVVIASTQHDVRGRASEHGAVFSDSFFNELLKGESLYDSFEEATDEAEEYYDGVAGKFQRPQLDDDGDGTPNEIRDGDFARQRHLLRYFGAIAPEIDIDTVRVYYPGGAILARVHTGGKPVNLVYAAIMPLTPIIQINDALTPEGMYPFDYPLIELLDPEGNGIYTGRYPEFDPLQHKILIYAKDSTGITAEPRTALPTEVKVPAIGKWGALSLLSLLLIILTTLSRKQNLYRF